MNIFYISSIESIDTTQELNLRGVFLIEPCVFVEWMIFFLKRVLFEWLRDRWKEQAHTEVASLKEITNRAVNLLNFQRLVTVPFFTSLCREFYPPRA
jgi:hypothetical protein